MEWLWRPAVALVLVFILALCWAFFKDYTCCPCRRRRPSFEEEQTPPVNTSPAFSIDIDAVPPTPPSPSQFQPLPWPYRPLGRSFSYDFGVTADANRVVQIKNGIPTLDLHGLKVCQAKYVTRTFLQQSQDHCHHVRIITGRGLHSVDGVPRIKPMVESMLNGYSYRVTSQGGCYEVDL